MASTASGPDIVSPRYLVVYRNRSESKWCSWTGDYTELQALSEGRWLSDDPLVAEVKVIKLDPVVVAHWVMDRKAD